MKEFISIMAERMNFCDKTEVGQCDFAMFPPLYSLAGLPIVPSHRTHFFGVVLLLAWNKPKLPILVI